MKTPWPLLTALFLAGCNGSILTPGSQENILHGSYYEKSSLQAEGRIRVEPGNDLTVKCTLSHTSNPEGPEQGDTWADFYLQFLKPEELHEGLTLDLQETSILAYVANVSARPTGYAVVEQENLTGQIKVVEILDSSMTLQVMIGSRMVVMKLNRGTLP